MKAYKHLRARLTCFCTVSIGCVLTALSAYSYIYAARQIEHRSELQFSSECASLFYTLGTQDAVSREWLDRMETAHSLLIEVTTTGREEQVYTSPGAAQAISQARDTARRQLSFDYLHTPDGGGPDRNEFLLNTGEAGYRAAVMKIPVGGQWVNTTILKNRSDEYAQQDRLRFVIGAGALVAIGALSVISWFFADWAIRPVAESHKNQTEFVSAISHELRTPLSVIQMSAENCLKASPEDTRRFARTIVKESKRLALLTRDLLDLSGTVRNGWNMSFSPQDPAFILLTAYESFELSAKEHQVSLRVITPDVQLPKIECDADRMQQVLAVLLENALQYTPAGGWIHLRVERQKRHIAFIVSDSGTGIPTDKRQKIFQRFYRGDPARTDNGHYGLGLSIALEFVLLHHGELLVEDSPLGGAEFTARIPF